MNLLECRTAVSQELGSLASQLTMLSPNEKLRHCVAKAAAIGCAVGRSANQLTPHDKWQLLNQVASEITTLYWKR